MESMIEQTKGFIVAIGVFLAAIVLLALLGRAVFYANKHTKEMLDAGYLYCYSDADHSGWNRPEHCLK